MDNDLVFATSVGTEPLAGNIRRSFRKILKDASLDETAWTPRELRHRFVSLLSDHGVPIEKIADLVGHAGTTVTEKVYRHQLRPVLLGGAAVMDDIFGTGPTLPGPRRYSVRHSARGEDDEHLCQMAGDLWTKLGRIRTASSQFRGLM